MSTNFSSEDPLVGKYVSVSKLEFDPYGDSWGYECYCLSVNNGLYTVRNKFGKEFKVNCNQIEKIIPITVEQKYQIGDIVEAKTDYNQYQREWIMEYCQVISVKNFANDFDYVLKDMISHKIYDVNQNHIVKVATLLENKYNVGTYVGVNRTIGTQQWVMKDCIKNGSIVKVNRFYTHVSYGIRYDTGETESCVYECNIVLPTIKNTQGQKTRDTDEFLRIEEERLLREIEVIRALRIRNQ